MLLATVLWLIGDIFLAIFLGFAECLHHLPPPKTNYSIRLVQYTKRHCLWLRVFVHYSVSHYQTTNTNQKRPVTFFSAIGHRTYNSNNISHNRSHILMIIGYLYSYLYLYMHLYTFISLGRVALGAQRPIVVKLSRERFVGLRVGPSVGPSVCRSVQCIVEKWRIGSGCRLAP